MSESKCQKCAELEAKLERVRTYSPVSATGCVLCKYDNGTFIKACGYHQELEWVRKNAAAMRDCLAVAAHAYRAMRDVSKGGGEECTFYTQLIYDIDAAISDDAGANYVSKNAVRPLRDALQSLVSVGVECVDGKPATYAWLGPESRKRINDALDHAHTIGL